MVIKDVKVLYLSATDYYAEWAFRMLTLFRSKDCEVSVLHAPPEPPTAEDVDERTVSEHHAKLTEYNAKMSAYSIADKKAMGLIVKHITVYAINVVKDATTAREMWAELKNAYENRTAANQTHLLDRLLRLKMSPNDKIEEHFARMDSVIAELKMAGVELGDEQLVSSILFLSMPNNYDPAVTALTMSAREDLTYEGVKVKLRNHSLNLNRGGTSSEVMIVSDVSKPANSGQGQGGQRSSKRGRRQQGNRGRFNNRNGNRSHYNNHSSGRRGGGNFYKRGRGRNFGGRRQYSQRSFSNSRNGGNDGGFPRDPRRDFRGNGNNNYNWSRNDGGQSNLIYCNNGNANSIQETDSFGFIGMLAQISDPQVQASQCSHSRRVAFYGDSGANRFVVIDDTLLYNVKILDPPVEIGVYSRETSIMATKIGTLYVVTDQGVKFKFDSVFYTPDGRCNILPISLLQYSNVQFKIEFFKAYLYTKDKRTNAERVLAIGEAINNNLYRFWFTVYGPNNAIALLISNEDQIDHLHRKFGHLSFRGLKQLFPELKINPNKLCKICLQAKQTHKPLNNQRERGRSQIPS